MKTSLLFIISILCLAAGCASPPREQSVASASGAQQSQTIDQKSDPSASVASGQEQSAFVATRSEIKDGSVTSFEYEGNQAILISSGGKYYAYANKCPKEGCALNYENGQLKCPCCGSVFDIRSGAVLSGPAKASLTALQVSIIDGNVYASA